MSAEPLPVAVLSLAEANLNLTRQFGSTYRRAEPEDFHVGLPLYTADASDFRLGGTMVPLRRHLAAGTTVALRGGHVTLRHVSGKTETLPVDEACERYWVCAK